MLNKFIINCVVTKPFEIKDSNDIKYVRIPVESVRDYKSKNGKYLKDYMYITAFGKNATSAFENFKPGSSIIAEGYITTSSFTKDNVKHNTLQLVASNIHDTSTASTDTGRTNKVGSDSNIQQSFDDDDLPF